MINVDDVIQHQKDGKVHRINGPAEVWHDGYWSWWANGKAHRYYGPCNKVGTWSIHNNRVKYGQGSWLK